MMTSDRNCYTAVRMGFFWKACPGARVVVVGSKSKCRADFKLLSQDYKFWCDEAHVYLPDTRVFRQRVVTFCDCLILIVTSSFKNLANLQRRNSKLWELAAIASQRWAIRSMRGMHMLMDRHAYIYVGMHVCIDAYAARTPVRGYRLFNKINDLW